MRKIILLMATLAGLTIANAPASEVQLGVYDPGHAFDKTPGLSFEQIWVRWDEPGKLLPRLKAITAKGRTPLLSIDPWSIKSIGSSDTLLPDIAAGKYDGITKELAKEIASLGSPVFIRWGSEMDRKMVQPWSGKSPASYIAAYRHFVTTFRAVSPKSQMVWAPIGNEGCQDYYPGGDVLDYTGISLYEYPMCTVSWYGQERSFSDWMNEKYGRLRPFNKPVIIVELGITGTRAKQKAWLQEAFASFGNYPLLKALLYYNDVDPVSWAQWGGTGRPDWSINPAFLNAHATTSLGVYDPNHTFDSFQEIVYEDVWTGWTTNYAALTAKIKSGDLLLKLNKIKEKHRTPIISVEPYPVWNRSDVETPTVKRASLLGDIIGGKYDNVIHILAKEIAAYPSPVIVRFAPEMERQNERKFWSGQPPENYIAAYRHFVAVFREDCSAPQMWSPIGSSGCERYYPGDDVVDFVGFSVYEVGVCSTVWFGHPMSFSQWMDVKYPSLAKFNKPIIIPETGIYGRPEDQASWVHDGLAEIGHYPLVRAVVYYDYPDPVSWKKWGGPTKVVFTINPKSFVAN